jgi:hypothetical protein
MWIVPPIHSFEHTPNLASNAKVACPKQWYQKFDDSICSNVNIYLSIRVLLQRGLLKRRERFLI